MRNKKIITALLAGILCVGSCVPAFAGTWQHSSYGDHWYYIKDNGAYAQNGEWIQDNGKTYFFYSLDTISDKGEMAKYSRKCNGTWYCFNPDGSLCSGGWNRSRNYGQLFSFTTKDGKIVNDRMFMVDGIIYFPRSEWGEVCRNSHTEPIKINFYNSYERNLYGCNKYGYVMNSQVVNKDGSPYPVDGELLKGETIPVYSSDGTYIKTIQN